MGVIFLSDQILLYGTIGCAAYLLVTSGPIAILWNKLSSRKGGVWVSDPRILAVIEALDLRDNAIGEKKAEAQMAALQLCTHYFEQDPPEAT